LPLPATQVEPATHWLLAVQTPTPLAQGQAVVQVRSGAVLQTGLSTHTTSLVAVPAWVCVWFAVQVVQGVHVAAFCVVEKVPLGQGVQLLSVVLLPACVELPALHVFHVWQALWFAVDVKVPLLQAWQTRSEVAVAAIVMRVPAAHVVNAAHFRSCVAVGACDSNCAAVHWLQTEHAVALFWELYAPLLQGAH
jgi:hypothetical protein